MYKVRGTKGVGVKLGKSRGQEEGNSNNNTHPLIIRGEETWHQESSGLTINKKGT